MLLLLSQTIQSKLQTAESLKHKQGFFLIDKSDNSD